MLKQIVIVGFMGSGKTTVARALANRLGYEVVDLDELITERVGRSPAKIIEEEGEPEFRQIETRVLREVMNEGRSRVIALGGGAWTISENRQLISLCDARAVWLDAPFDLCWKRIETSGEHRPLAPSQTAAEKLFYDRRPLYELADVRIRVKESASPAGIAMKIVDEFSPHDAS